MHVAGLQHWRIEAFLSNEHLVCYAAWVASPKQRSRQVHALHGNIDAQADPRLTPPAPPPFRLTVRTVQGLELLMLLPRITFIRELRDNLGRRFPPAAVRLISGLLPLEAPQWELLQRTQPEATLTAILLPWVVVRALIHKHEVPLRLVLDPPPQEDDLIEQIVEAAILRGIWDWAPRAIAIHTDGQWSVG